MTKFQAKRSLTLAAMLLTLLALFSFSCTLDAEPEPDDDGIKETSSFGGIAFFGEQTMAELTLRSEVVARVRFNAAEQTTEMLRYLTSTPNKFDEFYAGALVVTFDVKEYLKGSGGAQIRAVLLDGDSMSRTEAEARAAAGDLLAFREKEYDDRDAIVFLAKGPLIPRIQKESDLYFLAYLRANGRHAYTVESKYAKAWLPAASAQGVGGNGGAVGAAGSSGDSQLFITRVSDTGGGGDGAIDVRGQSGEQQESMTLVELKTFIDNVEAQVRAGGGTERYRECLIKKHARLSGVKLEQAGRAKANLPWVRQYPRSLASGSPAGSEVYEGGKMLNIGDDPDEPTWSDVAVIKSGADAALFNHTWPLKATTTRPLPAGEYRFYWAEQNELFSLCDALPEAYKTRDEIVVTVTAPEGTLHETMFDPVTLASGVGMDGSNGVLSAADLTVGGTSTSISGLKWDNNQVVLSLTTQVSLEGYRLEFIELDGSVELSLDVGDAAVDAGVGTLTWGVSGEPWEAGDLLMLRIVGG